MTDMITGCVIVKKYISGKYIFALYLYRNLKSI
jgi:hypothetical protein